MPGLWVRHKVVSARTGMRLAALLFSSARTAKSSISARRAFHCCRQLNVVGSVGGKKAGRYSKGSLQRLCPGQASKVPISVLYIALSSPLFMSGGEQRRASSIGSVVWPCVLSCCQWDLASS